MRLYDFLLFLHIGAIAIWVGGMATMHAAVRPAAMDLLAPAERIPFMAAALGRFFRLVLVEILLVLVSGIGMMLLSAYIALHIHVMAALGAIMIAIFGHIRFALYPRLVRSAAGSDWPAAASSLDGIRRLVALNFILGIVTIAVATLGRGFAAVPLPGTTA